MRIDRTHEEDRDPIGSDTQDAAKRQNGNAVTNHYLVPCRSH